MFSGLICSEYLTKTYLKLIDLKKLWAKLYLRHLQKCSSQDRRQKEHRLFLEMHIIKTLLEVCLSEPLLTWLVSYWILSSPGLSGLHLAKRAGPHRDGSHSSTSRSLSQNLINHLKNNTFSNVKKHTQEKGHRAKLHDRCNILHTFANISIMQSWKSPETKEYHST